MNAAAADLRALENGISLWTVTSQFASPVQLVQPIQPIQRPCAVLGLVHAGFDSASVANCGSHSWILPRLWISPRSWISPCLWISRSALCLAAAFGAFEDSGMAMGTWRSALAGAQLHQRSSGQAGMLEFGAPALRSVRPICSLTAAGPGCWVWKAFEAGSRFPSARRWLHG